jgi:hypothetical protein
MTKPLGTATAVGIRLLPSWLDGNPEGRLP